MYADTIYNICDWEDDGHIICAFEDRGDAEEYILTLTDEELYIMFLHMCQDKYEMAPPEELAKVCTLANDEALYWFGLYETKMWRATLPF